MKNIVHYTIDLNTFGGTIPDVYGETKIIGLEFKDVEKEVTDCYPIALDIAEDLANNILELVAKMRESK
ncbi:MAG: hypothetical protein J6Y02_02650 [Pseudobutyrivibrio sp.]|nr:hypothetical protein [Pseudobutyrivibrio sp.]